MSATKSKARAEATATRIGTSGWIYRDWRGAAFYPAGLRQREEFLHYAKQFDTVEINGSFYRLPVEGAPERWHDQAPENFLYAWKYPRWLTHYHRLQNPKESYERVFDRMHGLGPKHGPVLFQLPPQLTIDRERLAVALKLLPRGVRAAYEFRHPSWYEASIFDLLHEYDAALCVSDHADAPSPWEQTASWMYVRRHGPSGRYTGSYGEDALKRWAKSFKSWTDKGILVFCYFDNDIEAAAPKDAARLKALTATRGVAKRGARRGFTKGR